MKTRIIEVIGVAATVLCLALTGCDMGNTPNAQPRGAKGTVRVFVNTDAEHPAQTNSRTVVPGYPDFAYTLNFSAEGKPGVTTALNGNTGEVLLDEGIWTLIVLGEKYGEMVAESDPVTVMVSEEEATLSITVHPTLEGAAGTFSYSIYTEAGLTDVSAVLTPRNVGNAEQSEIALPLGWGEQTVAPGYYRFTLRAMKGNQPLIRREVVHIYSSTETYKSYYLTEEDFASAIYLGGTLVNGFEGYSPIAVAAYEDAECSVAIDESAVTDGAWNLEIEDTLGTVYFKVKLEKDGAVYYSKPVSVSDFPLTGKTDLVLPLEGYTVTFDANGGAFEGGGATVTLTAPENGILTSPSAPQGERAFTGWYSAGKRFTTETRIRGDTTVYAGWLIGAADIVDYLANASGGNSRVDPILVVLNSALANGGWESILSEINTAGKYVELDLSACAMDGIEFDPGTGAGADRVTALILPDAAKSIKAGDWSNPTFKAFISLASLSGAGVETIGYSAFNSCASLTAVSLPAATYIGGYAFSDCASLTEVSLPAATTVGERAFGWCASLTAVSLPVAMTIGMYAFGWCASLMEVSLPAATTIGQAAFNGCTSLAAVSLPAATSSGYGAFSSCTSLTAVSLPAATSIGGMAFYGCTSLTEVSLPMAATIGDSAFSSCYSLTAVSLPVATTIGDYAFWHCWFLTTVSLPVAQTIGDEAFYGSSLMEVSLPAVTTIGDEAFYGSSLTTVSLPASLTGIGSNPFSGCTGLTTITVDSANPAFTAHDGMLLDKAETTLIAYPSANGAITLPYITEIGDSAFSSCTSLTAVSLPVATTIGEYAFSSCTNLTEVSLPAATSSGYGAFYYCTSLTAVSLPVATTIGTLAFYRCDSLTAVSLPVATTIDYGAFEECNSLTAVSLPVATTIGGYAFQRCESLAEVNLPVATSIGYYAFEYCTSLTSVSLPATPPSISTGYNGIFGATGSSGTITISVPTGAVSAYTSTWGVDATTPAGGNTSVYGTDHKAVFITDAAQ